tara:strand:- start:476 stop:934 length:459 start_codon:yes stop_codon:yes gene_type:complete
MLKNIVSPTTGTDHMNLIRLLGIEAYTESDTEEYMNSNQINHFKELLIAWKTHLLQSAGQTATYLQNDDNQHPDITDSATQVEEHDNRIRFSERERKLTNRIDSTVHSIEDGQYGFCESCGAEIGVKRLEARPVANLCIDCKTLAEEAEQVY